MSFTLCPAVLARSEFNLSFVQQPPDCREETTTRLLRPGGGLFGGCPAGSGFTTNVVIPSSSNTVSSFLATGCGDGKTLCTNHKQYVRYERRRGFESLLVLLAGVQPFEFVLDLSDKVADFVTAGAVLPRAVMNTA